MTENIADKESPNVNYVQEIVKKTEKIKKKATAL